MVFLSRFHVLLGWCVRYCGLSSVLRLPSECPYRTATDQLSQQSDIHNFFIYLTLTGFVPATPHHPSLPSGRSEIAHLIYLVTLAPILITASTALYLVCAPYCILYFALVVSHHRPASLCIIDSYLGFRHHRCRQIWGFHRCGYYQDQLKVWVLPGPVKSVGITRTS
jgi:hypothetical protein